VIADEVYEHVQYDGRVHQSVMNHEELQSRSFAVYSFGKTLHITGWRVGYCVAPPVLTRELRKVHQFNTFSIAPTAGGHRALSSASSDAGARSRRSPAPSATCCSRASQAAALTCRRHKEPISSWPIIPGCRARSQAAATWNSPSG
jgi:aspartate/methionine/tyrosine aminotransferase